MVMGKQHERPFSQPRTQSSVIEFSRQLYEVGSCIRMTPKRNTSGVEINILRKSPDNTVDRRLGVTQCRCVHRDKEEDPSESTGI
jgi:hypothetical protein